MIGQDAAPLVLEVGSRLGVASDPLAGMAEAGLVQLQRQPAEALGDGAPTLWHRHLATDLDSSLPLRVDWLNQFPGYQRWSQEQGQDTLPSQRLDDLLAGQPLRLLRGDLRGRDIRVLTHGEQGLEQLAQLAQLAQLELLELLSAPTPLQQDGTSLFELGSWLAARGFVLHCFRQENRRLLRPDGSDGNPYTARNQLVQLAAVFMPDPVGWIDLAPERLAALAFLAHGFYRSSDLSQRALQVLDQRDGGTRLERYRSYLDHTGFSG